jgi:hypothetical protein
MAETVTIFLVLQILLALMSLTPFSFVCYQMCGAEFDSPAWLLFKLQRRQGNPLKQRTAPDAELTPGCLRARRASPHTVRAEQVRSPLFGS